MKRSDTIRVTRTPAKADKGWLLPAPQDVTEGDFRKLLAATFGLAADPNAGAFPPVIAHAFETIADFLSDHDPTGAADDYSLLGTFTTAVQMIEDGAVPEGCECPACGADMMDDIFPEDDGTFTCHECGCHYDGRGEPA